MPTIGFNKFFLQTCQEIPGYTEACTLYLKEVFANPQFSLAEPGYRSGVLLYPVPLFGDFRSRVTKIMSETEFVTFYKSRVPGEDPRKKTMVLVDELPLAKYLTAVLYHSKVLDEDGDRSTDCDWEIVALLCQVDEEEPIPPSTLMANHFKADGGTATLMDPKTFETELRVSFNYWKNRAMAMTRKEYALIKESSNG